VGAERDDERRGVDEEDRPRRGGEGEVPVDEDELAGEEEADQDPVAERAVPPKERDAAGGGPPPQADGGDRRPEAGLGERRDAGVADLDGDLPEPPDGAQQKEPRHGGQVEAGAAGPGVRIHETSSYPGHLTRDAEAG